MGAFVLRIIPFLVFLFQMSAGANTKRFLAKDPNDLANMLHLEEVLGHVEDMPRPPVTRFQSTGSGSWEERRDHWQRLRDFLASLLSMDAFYNDPKWDNQPSDLRIQPTQGWTTVTKKNTPLSFARL